MFDYDWFHGNAFREQQEDARARCAFRHFPEISPEEAEASDEFQEFYGDIQTRRLVYLRDGFSYELRELAETPSKSHLLFECEPADDHYKVGAFVVSIPFEEIVRVEVFAVHPSEKPEDNPQITGFRSRHAQAPGEDPAGRPPLAPIHENGQTDDDRG